jgi:hypothetical protein
MEMIVRPVKGWEKPTTIYQKGLKTFSFGEK